MPEAAQARSAAILPEARALGLTLLIAAISFPLIAWVIARELAFVPVAWCFLAWAGIAGALAVWQRRSWLSALLWCNATGLLLGLAMLEAGYYHMQHREIQPTTTVNGQKAQFYHPDPVLGYAPAGPASFHAVSLKPDGSTVFDVHYTVDAAGHRTTPPPVDPADPRSIVFFGCSYTFGYGVDDDATLPYQTGKLSGLRIHNFACNGYGPHQMLAAIENGLVAKAVTDHPALIVYHLIPSHNLRSAGYSDWDQHSLRYTLAADGSVQADGHFDDSWFGRVPRRLLIDSAIFQQAIAILNAHDHNRSPLTVGIIRRSRDLLRQAYPHARFCVVYWDGRTSESDALLKGLRQADIPVYLMSDILPGYPDDAAKYRIMPPFATHPNAIAYSLIAQYLVDHVLPAAASPADPTSP